MDKLNINGTELSLDLLDADVLEKYESLNSEVAVRIKEPTQYEGLSNADAMRLQCRIVDEFFDGLFGAGTAVKVFGDNNNLGIRMEAFGQVAQYAASANDRIRDIQRKYTTPEHAGKEPQDFMGRKKSKHKNRTHFAP